MDSNYFWQQVRLLFNQRVRVVLRFRGLDWFQSKVNPTNVKKCSMLELRYLVKAQSSLKHVITHWCVYLPEFDFLLVKDFLSWKGIEVDGFPSQVWVVVV